MFLTKGMYIIEQKIQINYDPVYKKKLDRNTNKYLPNTHKKRGRNTNKLLAKVGSADAKLRLVLSA